MSEIPWQHIILKGMDANDAEIVARFVPADNMGVLLRVDDFIKFEKEGRSRLLRLGH